MNKRSTSQQLAITPKVESWAKEKMKKKAVQVKLYKMSQSTPFFPSFFSSLEIYVGCFGRSSEFNYVRNVNE